jgi:hypothetical protein
MEPFVSRLFPLLTSPVFPSELAALAVLAVPLPTESALGHVCFLIVALTIIMSKQCLECTLHLLTADRFSSLGQVTYLNSVVMPDQ